MTTIRSHDGNYEVHGTFEYWCSNGGFIFDSCAFRHRYCNTDFWQIIESNPLAPMVRLEVQNETK